MSLGVLKSLFEHLHQRQHAEPETAGVSPDVSAKPAPALGCTPETAETARFDDSGKRVATQAANDPGDAIAAWIERAKVQGHEGAPAATLDRFARGSAALDRQIAAAGGPDPDPDRDCWPHSPAMNTAEIERFGARLVAFMGKGLRPDSAEALANRLVRHDRDGDGRRTCLECSHDHAGRCGNWRAAGLGKPRLPEGMATQLQRCPGFWGAR
ncbi:hypothetical protein [Acidovorax sp. SDU_ACID1]|uniref:hypothetical protein n=1 Tax=Acidovorax sp. SDU_ACID1 TaxID=3136632 RepID=UPI0038736BE2